MAQFSLEMRRLLEYQLELSERLVPTKSWTFEMDGDSVHGIQMDTMLPSGIEPPTLGDVKDTMDSLTKDQLANICGNLDVGLRKAMDKELVHLEFDYEDEWVAVMLGFPTPVIEEFRCSPALMS